MRTQLSQLLERNLGFSERQRQALLDFYDLVLEENQVQNLTRLTSPEDFYFGHILDVVELLKLNLLSYPALDLGSGAGVPGLVAAILDEQKWVLTESEGKKADFLARANRRLGLQVQVSVFAGRAENYLKQNSVGSIVSRAVGSVEKIYGWIRNCSTWNNLILMKGPSWQKEWGEFQAGRLAGELTVYNEHPYSIGPEQKSRTIICLTRNSKNVPRGTR
jgi:16S rRNA (guanine527-N7)-methyltransferase